MPETNILTYLRDQLQELPDGATALIELHRDATFITVSYKEGHEYGLREVIPIDGDVRASVDRLMKTILFDYHRR